MKSPIRDPVVHEHWRQTMALGVEAQRIKARSPRREPSGVSEEELEAGVRDRRLSHRDAPHGDATERPARHGFPEGGLGSFQEIDTTHEESNE